MVNSVFTLKVAGTNHIDYHAIHLHNHNALILKPTVNKNTTHYIHHDQDSNHVESLYINQSHAIHIVYVGYNNKDQYAMARS